MLLGGEVQGVHGVAHVAQPGVALDLPAEQDATLWTYLEMAAHSMQNR